MSVTKKLRVMVLLFLAGMISGSNLFAADARPPSAAEEDKNREQECQRVKELKPPQADMPTKQMMDANVGCESDDLYYDTQSDLKPSQADWDKVRVCAFAKDDNAVLMMLYANGYGVKQNYDLALKYACAGGGEFPEVLVAQLMELKETGEPPEKPFDQCLVAGSTLAINYCNAMAEKQDGKVRKRKLDEISGHWSPAQRFAFEKLRKSVADFANARAYNETDQGGSARTVNSIQASETEKNLLQIDIEQYEKGALPKYTQAQFAEFDNKLNETYRALRDGIGEVQAYPNGATSMSRADLKESQKYWLKYRDAWVDFGRMRYPSVPPHAWKALLTERRIKQLEELQNENP